ncbi:hypothetical protein DM806_09495 [Sphingobium lactosutens]|uniref:hypothetical protein n=1 Tax=Sphingobium lactosutens TaxID=522773 RepID=UPI0015C1AC30|nr:hypothetical protein [Sphingobium lactosutens]NWK95904.1 hypothetical protein [Sphingobium lactosutens]
MEPNSFGTHEYMDFVEQIGSEAYVETMMPSSVFAQNLNSAQVSTPRVQDPNETKRIAVGQGLGETAYTSASMKA